MSQTRTEKGWLFKCENPKCGLEAMVHHHDHAVARAGRFNAGWRKGKDGKDYCCSPACRDIARKQR